MYFNLFRKSDKTLIMQFCYFFLQKSPFFVSHGSTSYHERSLQEKKEDMLEVNDFIKANVGKSVMVFSDGSVYDGSVGCGACAAVLIADGD